MRLNNKKLSQIAFISLMGITFYCLPAFGLELYYQDTVAKQYADMHITRTGSGYTVKSTDDRSDSMVYQLDSNCATREWQYINHRTSTRMSISRSNNAITAAGEFKGHPFSKVYKIDNSPWFQEWSLPAEVFARSGEKSIKGWSIDPENMGRIVQIQFTARKPDSIGYMGQMVGTYHIQVALTGLIAVFTKGDYWVRQSDDRAIRSRMPRGIGREPTTSELITESQK